MKLSGLHRSMFVIVWTTSVMLSLSCVLNLPLISRSSGYISTTVCWILWMNPNLICKLRCSLDLWVGDDVLNVARLWTSETVCFLEDLILSNGLCVQLWQSDSCLLYLFIVWQPWTFFSESHDSSCTVWSEPVTQRNNTRQREEAGNICSAGQDLCGMCQCAGRS